MSHSSILAIEQVVDDLRLAVEYAARAGLLRQKDVFDTLRTAEQTLKADGEPDVYALTNALNDLTQLIAPMTLADLHSGRDPFKAENQRMSKFLQLGLTIFALLVLLTVGYFMQALRLEQDAILALAQIQELHPQLKLTTLRKMAQYHDPMVKQSPLYDDFNQRMSELRQINSRVYVTYTNALLASNLPLLPFGDFFSTTMAAPSPPSRVSDDPRAVTLAAGPGTVEASAPTVQKNISSESAHGSTSAAESSQGLLTSSQSKGDDFCVAESDGSIRVPSEALAYPDWLKRVLSETLGDFCFQIKVLSRGGDSALLTQAMNQLSFVSHIKDKAALRATWFLPFLFGLLGSALYLMRNVASVRTPAMEWFPMTMRISLGGVAGIVVGWFSFSAAFKFESAASLSVPFALAFLTGYGIDVLFSLLDRLNRALDETTRSSQVRS